MALFDANKPTHIQCPMCSKAVRTFEMWNILMCMYCFRDIQEAKSVNERLWELEQQVHSQQQHEHIGNMKF